MVLHGIWIFRKRDGHAPEPGDSVGFFAVSVKHRSRHFRSVKRRFRFFLRERGFPEPFAGGDGVRVEIHARIFRSEFQKRKILIFAGIFQHSVEQDLGPQDPPRSTFSPDRVEDLQRFVPKFLSRVIFFFGNAGVCPIFRSGYIGGIFAIFHRRAPLRKPKFQDRAVQFTVDSQYVGMQLRPNGLHRQRKVFFCQSKPDLLRKQFHSDAFRHRGTLGVQHFDPVPGIFKVFHEPKAADLLDPCTPVESRPRWDHRQTSGVRLGFFQRIDPVQRIFRVGQRLELAGKQKLKFQILPHGFQLPERKSIFVKT